MSNKPQALYVGVDWGDQTHVAWWTDGTHQGTAKVRQAPESIAKWVDFLREKFPQHQVMIALEQSRGALFVGLADYPELELYPINPKQLANYRKAFYPSGGKNDPNDAELLADFLKNHHGKLRPWTPEDEQTRRIAEMSELRRKLVDDRKRVVSVLMSSLKIYFPQALTLVPHSLHHPFGLDLLHRWPDLRTLQRVHPRTLRKFLAEHGMKNKEQQTQFIEAVRSARPLTRNQAIVRARARYVQTLSKQIRELNKAIADFDEELHQLVASHNDEQLFRSLPGAGDALVPRLIAVFGSDRERYESAQEVQCRTGIAPLIYQSGKSRFVAKRIACPKFTRQTFHEFADHARRWSPWSRAFYDMKRAAGMKHQAAVRALAFKWIRIIFRMWKTRTNYSEADYIRRLEQSNSPVVKFLESR